VKSHALASFWQCYDALPEHVQKLAKKNFALFKINSRRPSLGFQNKGGVYTVEIVRSYRAIARDRSDVMKTRDFIVHQDSDDLRLMACADSSACELAFVLEGQL